MLRFMGSQRVGHEWAIEVELEDLSQFAFSVIKQRLLTRWVLVKVAGSDTGNKGTCTRKFLLHHKKVSRGEKISMITGNDF